MGYFSHGFKYHRIWPDFLTAVFLEAGVLRNIPLHYVEMCRCDWFNKELNGQELGRKRLGGISGDRED